MAKPIEPEVKYRAHLNPAVTLADAWLGEITWRETSVYILAQLAGVIAGVTAAHLMLGLPVFDIGSREKWLCAAIERIHRNLRIDAVIWGCAWLPRPSCLLSSAGTSRLRIGSLHPRPLP